MTEISNVTIKPSPDHVWVCGNDHSPWVQAVLLGLHEKNIAHTNITLPPLSVFLDSGVLMPAVKIDDGPWLLDSERILVKLGYSEVEKGERRALMKIFMSNAMRRVDDAWQFWRRFSLVRDCHPVAARKYWNHFWRAFSIFYFFRLIRFGRRQRPAASAEQLVKEFSFLQDRLGSDQLYFGGDAPNTVDFQLFGLVQMCASIPAQSLAVLQDNSRLERLRSWTETMQSRFEDYAHLYTAPYFDPKRPLIEPARPFERALFWLGAVSVWIAFPVSLAVEIYVKSRIRKKRM